MIKPYTNSDDNRTCQQPLKQKRMLHGKYIQQTIKIWSN